MGKYILTDELVDKLYKEAEIKNKEIERLRKEKEWLINDYAASIFHYNEFNKREELTVEKAREDMLEAMQQALKEG